SFAEIREAFHTEIHAYDVNGEMHFANASEPQIPEALARVTAGISALNNFRFRPAIQVKGRAQYDRKTHTTTPEFTLSGGSGSFYGVAPEDFATEYDVAPLYAAGVNGSGVTIGILNYSNVDLSVDNAYRQTFGLASNPVQVVTDGGDPGVNSDDIEAYLDVEVSGAIAPAATVNLYVAAADNLHDPLLLAAQRAVDD